MSGPRGMDKMLVDTLGDVTLLMMGLPSRNGCSTSSSKMMVEVAKSVDNEVGDGMTSSVIFLLGRYWKS
jgi:chaperonin GroEL (HSP60 family)